MAGAIVAMGGGPLLHAEARLEDELLRLAPSERPILSDLRESGSIEQDADLVMFIYRDEYYNGEESDQQGLAEVILAKHRNGPTGTGADAVKLSFLRRYAKFTDLAGAAAA